MDDERRLFEKICLEGFQAGLSWLTILNKRESFRSAFANFDAEQVARFDARRHQAPGQRRGHSPPRGQDRLDHQQCTACDRAAKEFGSLGAFVWRLEPEAKNRPARITHEAVKAMPTSPASTALSKDLQKRGWTFVGPTTMYAFMQAMGLVNDHIEGCASRKAALAARKAFTPPKLP